MLKTYIWPNLDHSAETPEQEQTSLFLALPMPEHDTDITSAFQDMNDLFLFSSNQGSGAAVNARFDDADVAAARAEGMEAAQALYTQDQQRQEQEIDHLKNLLARQENILAAYRREVEDVSKNLISCLLDVLGQGGLRIDEKGWNEALCVLRQALAPNACTLFSSSLPIPGHLAQDGEAIHTDHAIAAGEIQATDGTRTFALSLMDLAYSIKNALVDQDTDAVSNEK